MERESSAVLPVKFKIPTPRAGYIIRSELMEKLERQLRRKVLVVKAGAGCGKTTLLSVFILEKRLSNVKWITMDSSMNQALVFWNYLFQALEGELKDGSGDLKSCFQETLPREMLKNMLALFGDRLTGEHEIYLVLDDFQNIRDRWLLDTISQFLSAVPDSFHMILLSRTMPGIHVGTMYMDNSLGVIDEEDLRLSNAECESFLVHTLGMKKGSLDTEQITEEANGWIGGAQLMAVAGKVRKNRQAVFACADEWVIDDYIEYEIFSMLSEEEQQFLEKTAVLSYFNESICEKYLPEYPFSRMMKKITEKNLFVILADEEKEYYRYHAILREFLNHRLDGSVRRRDELCKRAADIMFEYQDYGECVRLLQETKAYKRLMERLLQMPQNTETFGYMMQVPMEAVLENPNFAYQYFFLFYASLELEKCKQIYDSIRKNLQEDITFQGFQDANLFFDINWECKEIQILTYEQICSLPLNQITKAYLLVKESYFLFLSDRMQEAYVYLDRAQEIYLETGNSYLELFIITEKTQMLESYGEFTRAFELYGRMEELVQKIPTMKSSYYIGIAGLYLRQMRMEEAKRALDMAGEVMKPGIETIASAYFYTLAEWYYVEGYPEKTAEIITGLMKEKLYQSAFFMARILRYPVYRGKDRGLALQYLEAYEDTEKHSRNMDSELLYIGILFELKNRQKAAELLNQLLARARKGKNKLKIVECTLMQARFLYLQKSENRKRIGNMLVEALTYAASEGIRVPLWFEKDFLKQLLTEQEGEVLGGLTKEQLCFIRQILEGREHPACQDPAEKVNGLTEREKEVLLEIAKGRSNKEIAEALSISIATVKTHLINIYSKLGVNNRIAAVNKMKR